MGPKEITSSATPTITSKKSRPRRPIAPLIALDQPGRLRIANLMALFSMSHQSVYNAIRDQRLPPADGYDGPRPYWLNSTIKPLLERGRP